MKYLSLILLACLITTFSCSSQDGDFGSNEAQGKKGKKLVMTPVYNNQTGALMAHVPLPKKWKLKENQLEGPHNIVAKDLSYKFFTSQQRSVLTPEQIVKEDLEPLIQQDGGKILGTFNIPELASYDKAYNNLLWKFGNPKVTHNALGVDIEATDGKGHFIIVRQMITQDYYSSVWSYSVNYLEADKKAIEEAKSDYIFALCHTQPNMEQIAEYNRNEIAKSNASWAAHQKRMAANQAAFNARNQAWMKTSNEISEMSMHGWRERNAINDKGHSAAVNGILEEETIYDSQSGTYMNVEAGSNRYFTNGNNEYIRTDNYLYDPNLDNSVNTYEWREWKGN